MSALVAIGPSFCFWLSVYVSALIAGSVQVLGNSGDKTLIIREVVPQDDHALGGDFIFAELVGIYAQPCTAPWLPQRFTLH